MSFALNLQPQGTGRENRTTHYCIHCDWESDEYSAPLCPICQQGPIHYVRWEAGVEDEAARQAIAETRAGAKGITGP